MCLCLCSVSLSVSPCSVSLTVSPCSVSAYNEILIWVYNDKNKENESAQWSTEQSKIILKGLNLMIHLLVLMSLQVCICQEVNSWEYSRLSCHRQKQEIVLANYSFQYSLLLYMYMRERERVWDEYILIDIHRSILILCKMSIADLTIARKEDDAMPSVKISIQIFAFTWIWTLAISAWSKYTTISHTEQLDSEIMD